MRSVYGEMILPKGTTLYHASQDPFAPNPLKPMLFTTFHPSEWCYAKEEHITPITLLRPVSLFFMVGGFSGVRLLPLLDTIIGQPGNNLVKRYDQNLACYVRHLQAEKFDGWFSTIEGKSQVEVALINSPGVYEVGPSHRIGTPNWNRDLAGPEIQRRFGLRFPISLFNAPATLTLNSRFRIEIEQYLRKCAQGGENEYIGQILLTGATITYFDAPSAYVTWDCVGLRPMWPIH